jgi:hypothetical protein
MFLSDTFFLDRTKTRQCSGKYRETGKMNTCKLRWKVDVFVFCNIVGGEKSEILSIILEFHG